MKKVIFILIVLVSLLIGCAPEEKGSSNINIDVDSITDVRINSMILSKYVTPRGFPNLYTIIDGNTKCYSFGENFTCVTK